MHSAQGHRGHPYDTSILHTMHMNIWEITKNTVNVFSF
jgi:hypothetical protein